MALLRAGYMALLYRGHAWAKTTPNCLAYAHGVMVAGAIVVAVAIEEIIAHPNNPAHLPTILVAVLGPAIYLAGSAVFYRTMAERIPMAYFG